MNSTCTCRESTSYGPGILAAQYLYWSSIRAERTSGDRRFRARHSDFEPGITLGYLGGLLDGDAPVRVDVAAVADDLGRKPEHLVAELGWLADSDRFLHQEGFADGVMRLWLNPAVACDGGTDPRPLAARYRFPYPVLGQGGLSAPEPVRFLEYSAALWEELYTSKQQLFDTRRVPDPACRSCSPTRLHLV
ncbi:hypothetical protein [Kitasatospora sp. NPDC088134]|uniref:hypothetical protein n=1 Tax=Kitasatospora sp. NPDC088134 TaxID=3364071 RepID=UPI00382D5A3A